ncbi:hypothetical protein [Halobaculum gomorrense]|nr:hypothetical protein [Halobaculum gomorrense]
MEIVDRAVFTCDDCGASAPSFGIEYDTLGYPVCPRCETAVGPLARRRLGEKSATAR